MVEVDTVAVALDGDVTERLTAACAEAARIIISTATGTNRCVNFLPGSFCMPSKVNGIDEKAYWAVTLALL